MALFAFITDTPLTDPAVLSRIDALSADRRQVAPNVWILATRGTQTSQDLSLTVFPELRAIEPGKEFKSIRHVVLRIDSWWGFHDRSLWEWMDSVRKRDA